MSPFRILLVTAFLLFSASASAAQNNSCWGEASAAFAQLGLMGEHSSQQSNPRQGLANTARALYDVGVISEPTLGALAEFLSAVAGITLDRCLSNHHAVVEAEKTAAQNAACWGQASKVFAATGMMGQHSSRYDNPRLGLRNLARYLYDAGVIADDSMAALGAFVASELGYDISACQ